MPLVQTRGAASAQGFGEFSQQTAVNYIEDVFSTYLYSGNDTSQTINNGLDLSTKGGLVWIKARNAAYSHILSDTIRGTGKFLSSNTTDAQGTDAQDVTAFNTNGFTVGNNGRVNNSSFNYCSWTFREQAKFFDIVTYTGNGATGAGQSISHNLGSTPGMIIVKTTSGTGNWKVYHRLGNAGSSAGVGNLNTTDDFGSPATSWFPSVTSTTFSVSDDGSGVNNNGNSYVAYLFAHNAGGFGTSGTDNVISCGSWTGNGSTTGPVVTLGYEPQWIMYKQASSAGNNWFMVDNMRGLPVGGTTSYLIPNTTAAEGSGLGTILNINATGFQLKTTAGSANGSGETYIYMAIRRGPMKVPTTGTSVFYPKVHAGSSSYAVGFPTDLCISGDQSGNALNSVVVYRLAGNDKYFGGTASTAAEQTVSVCQFDLQNSFQLSYNSNNQARWHFRRAPGFFDEVCYTGTGANQNITHNLGVAPELIICKTRSGSSSNWVVWNTTLNSSTGYLYLNADMAASNFAGVWNGAPTSTYFTLGTNFQNNASGQTFVAYLFATCAGVSKVGSYTGTGTTQTINCGFTAGARFVLIKRTDGGDSTPIGDWYVWDSARGIIAGNDPYLLLNSTAAEVTGTDYVDTAATGFEISSTAPAAINANGGSFIFLAIA